MIMALSVPARAESEDVRVYLDAHPGLRDCVAYSTNPSPKALNDLVARKLLSEVERDEVFRGQLDRGASECALLADQGMPLHIGPHILGDFERMGGGPKGPFDIVYTLDRGPGGEVYAFFKDGKLLLRAGGIID